MAGSEVPPLEELVLGIQGNVLGIERTLARIETRLGDIDRVLAGSDALSRKMDGLVALANRTHESLAALIGATARLPSGETLTNVVGQIRNKVNTLD